MSYSLNRQVYFKLAIDGVPVDAKQVMVLTAAVRSHVLYHLPTVDLQLNDQTGFIARNCPLGDNSVLTVTLAQSERDNTLDREYRVFAVHPGSAGGHRIYRISGYLNHPAYLLNRETKHWTGTATGIMGQIAQSQGWDTDIDPSADSQSWMCVRNTLAHFLRHELVQHAYASESSAFLHVVSEQRPRLRVKNLDTVAGLPLVANAANIVDGQYQYAVLDYAHQEQSGLLARQGGGYGARGYEYDLVNAVLHDHSGVRVRKTNATLNFNKAIQAVAQVRFNPLQMGNTHPKKRKGALQNHRILSLYASQLELLIGRYSNVDVLDPVGADIYVHRSAEPQLSGKAILIGKARAILNGNYYEKWVLVRNGSDQQNQTLY